jgi:TolB-like protein
MIYQAEHFSLDTTSYRLLRDGSPHPIEPQVFDLIIYLIDNRDRVVARDELLDKLWNGRIVSDNAINARIKLARRALGDTGKLQKFIKTIHRRGYQFIGECLNPSTPGSGANAGVTPVSAIAAKPSIVVLPIEAPDDDASGQSIAKGLTEVIIANLSCYRELLVIDPESAFAYRADENDSADFAERLAVEYVVKGGIRRSGKRVRISVQLLEPGTGKTLWVQRLDRKQDDIFDLEDEVATRIAINLVGHIDEKSRAGARYKRPENLTAFDCVVRARPGVESQDCDENAAARILLRQAIELDPSYATAYANLALNHCAEYESPWCDTHDEVLQQAQGYAQKAVALDDFDSNAHIAIASVQLQQKKFALAETHLDKAIECNPNSYNAFCYKSWVLALSGRAVEVEACGATALRLNPLAPDGCLMAIMLGYYTQRNYTAALDMLGRIEEPFDLSEAFRAACLAQLGRDRQAQQAVVRATELGGDWIRQGDWLQVWPFKNQADEDHVLDGLYKSGLLADPTTAREKP